MTMVRTDAPPVVAGEAVDHGDALYWQGHADHRGEATALLGTDAAVLRTTPAFDALLGGEAPAGGWSTEPGECARIAAALARATARSAPQAAAVRFHRGMATLIVIARPIPWPTRLLHAPAGVAIATLIDPAHRPPPAPLLWREAFDLTPAEAGLAALLMTGHSLESAAAARDCRPATLRVHLRHVFAKTGVSRQSDLVALLARMG